MVKTMVAAPAADEALEEDDALEDDAAEVEDDEERDELVPEEEADEEEADEELELAGGGAAEQTTAFALPFVHTGPFCDPSGCWSISTDMSAFLTFVQSAEPTPYKSPHAWFIAVYAVFKFDEAVM